MKKYIMLILMFPMLLQAQEPVTISTLFDSLKVNPNTRSDELLMERALAGKRAATGALFPKIDAFGGYNYSNTPNGMLPLAPNDLFKMIKDQTIPQPFSQNIFNAGGIVSMPLFVKTIYSMAGKAKKMYESAEAKKNIDLLKNEAVIVSSNSMIRFLESMDKALTKKRESLLKTKEMVEIKVKNGRAPESALLKINSAINQVGVTRNQIAMNREKAIAAVYALTNVKLNTALPMEQTGTYEKGDYKALEPLQKKVEATKMGMRAERDKLYPALILHGTYNHSYGKAYNIDTENSDLNPNVNEDYATVGVTLKIPIFEKSQYSKIKMSKVEWEQQKAELDKMRLEFTAEANQLEKSLVLLDNSVELYKKSVQDKTKLLGIAKVAYSNDRMTIEDYLKYEDDLVLEESNLYKAEAEKWQTLMKLAVIYGNNIEQMVK